GGCRPLDRPGGSIRVSISWPSRILGAVREIPAKHGLPAVFGGVSRPRERQEALLNRCRLTKNRRAQLTRPQGVPTSTPKPRRLVKTGEDGAPPKSVTVSRIQIFLETVATLPGDLGLIPIAEALKSATSRTGGKSNVIARGPEPCSPSISRARSRIGPGYLAPVSFSLILWDRVRNAGIAEFSSG